MTAYQREIEREMEAVEAFGILQDDDDRETVRELIARELRGTVADLDRAGCMA